MATNALADGNGCTAESEALKQAFNYLVKSIDTNALLPASMGRNLITEFQRSECASEPDPYKKAGMFLGHLRRAVNGDCDKFHTFVQILYKTGQDTIGGNSTRYYTLNGCIITFYHFHIIAELTTRYKRYKRLLTTTAEGMITHLIVDYKQLS